MSKQLPVWRMNTGKGVPSDYGGVAYTPNSINGSIDTFSQNRTDDSLWFIDADDSENIYAYQTTRTKAAKYRGK